MILHEGLILIFLVLLLRSDSFMNNFRSPLIPRAPDFKLLAAGDDLSARDELFLKGLKLWNKYFVSLEQWDTIERSDSDGAFEVSMTLNSESIVEIIRKFEFNSQLMQEFPMIPDLVVKMIINRGAEGVVLENNEIETVVNFFLKHRFYRQLSSLIALNHQISSDHFTHPSLDDLISTLENLFQLKPERVERFIGEIGTDKLFLVAPLVACVDCDQNIVRGLLKKFATISRAQFLVQICSGIMVTNYTPENERLLFERNENLINYIYEIFINPSTPILIIFKACKVMNLIRLNGEDFQRIFLENYMDESPGSVNILFDILLNVAAKNPYRSISINSYRF